MPIRKSVSTNAAPKPVDHRGTVSLGSNPYKGSHLDKLGVPQEIARPVSNALAYMYGVEHPNQTPVQDLLARLRMMDNPGDGVEYRYRQRIRSPLTAVRGFCVECQGGSPKAVGECDAVSCPLWALRLGRNAHYGKKS